MTTLVEVARAAGVTAATVSNVLRNRGKVGEDTRRRVLAAVEALGYRPNLMARALVEGKPHTMALVVSSIANPFYPEFALEVERAARKLGYFLLVCNTNDDPAQERAYLDAVGGALAQGVIVMNADFVQLDALQDLRRRGVPVVLCMWERPQEPPPLPCIAVDLYQAGVLAAEHLLRLGHKRLGAVSGSEPSGNHKWRLQGFIDTVQKAGVELPASHLRYGHDTIDEGRNAAHSLLAGVPGLTAVFATNDLPALGVLQAAAELGLEVPRDLSVIGVTDIQLAHQMRPALSTVAMPTAEAAMLAVQMLQSEINAKPDHPLPMSVTEPPKLVVRGSTGKPKQ
ncbi:LacI family DNA-binding transcriptional regulator [Roseateles sp. SL47]|jgi:DNA-binding LacI/PurR family transcriptional regulator|uniref:LacI family DNA-binding transcriptional regulator n=1 Tax=Roseateles sp. SL47 TaxID=2995138 RepID=UPI00226D966F|nr:LacI family DNA-binding transcriptional regulator [Roseateles sp. SL47]WAC71386.1 LacI family DNA-binding transcriptional regulator [Roseateles sp. SL47]